MEGRCIMDERYKKSFEQYVNDNKDILSKELENLDKEDLEDAIAIKARNPENPSQILEWRFFKNHYEKLKIDSIELGIPKEELAFIIIMYTLEASEITPIEEKQKIRQFLDRQMTRIKNNVDKNMVSIITSITIKQFKDKLNRLNSIPMQKLDLMESSWREQFKSCKSSVYRDEDIYVKIKFAELL